MTKNTTKDSGKKLYEIAYILIDPATENAIADLLSQYKAVISYKSSPADIKLAYPIKKHSSAFFGYAQFELEPENVQKVKESIRLNQSILRFLIIVKLKVKKAVSSGKKPEIRKYVKIEAAPAPKSVLTNEALEEKLEEILK